MNRFLALIIIAACGSSSPPPPAQPVANATTANNAVATPGATDRAEGVIVTTETTSPPACCTSFVKSAPLGKYGQVQVWKGAADQITKYVVVFGTGSTWRLAEPLDYIEGGDCGAGHCIDRKLQTLVITNNVNANQGAHDGFRITFTVSEDRYLTEGHAKHDDISTHDVVVDCTLSPTPTCTDGRSPQR